jgi:hypothetical protein
MGKLRVVLLGCALAVIAACSEHSGHKRPAAPAVAGEASKSGAFLAYEHSVWITAPAETLPARMEAVHSACADGRFGTCTLLNFDQDGAGSSGGRMAVRIVPAGVEALVKLAGEGGEISARQTKAEDRAEAIADIEQKKDLLKRQQSRLLEFQGRKDLPIADVLALARELAQIEGELDRLSQARSNEQRRVETNLLTIAFSADRAETESRLGRIGKAFGRGADELTEGTVNTIEFVAYALPALLVLILFVFAFRWIWRRFGGKHRSVS